MVRGLGDLGDLGAAYLEMGGIMQCDLLAIYTLAIAYVPSGGLG